MVVGMDVGEQKQEVSTKMEVNFEWNRRKRNGLPYWDSDLQPPYATVKSIKFEGSALPPRHRGEGVFAVALRRPFTFRQS